MPTPKALAALAAKREMTKADFDSLSPDEKREFIDANSDGTVNVDDLLNTTNAWGNVPPPASIEPTPPDPLPEPPSPSNGEVIAMMEHYGLAYPVSTNLFQPTTIQELREALGTPKASVIITKDFTTAATIDIASDVYIQGNGHTLFTTGGFFPLRTNSQRVVIDRLYLSGGGLQLRSGNTDVCYARGHIQSASRYFDLDQGSKRFLCYQSDGRGCKEYSIWGQGVDAVLHEASFIGSLDQTMIRLYNVHRFICHDSELDTAQAGKQSIRIIDCDGEVQITNSLVKRGRITMGNSAERWWSDGTFRIENCDLDWAGTNGCIEIQPSAKNGIVTKNRVLSAVPLTHGMWPECPNVKVFDNKLNGQTAPNWQTQ